MATYKYSVSMGNSISSD